MSLTQTINYDNAGNFAFDNTLIEFSGSLARLKKQSNPGQTFAEDFADDTDFTYDSDLAEFVGGSLRQKAQRPADATFGARFDSFVDANWADGSRTADVTGGAAISGGKLDLTGGSKFVAFDAAGNASLLAAVGCFRFRFTPAYNGSPSQNQIYIDLFKESSGNNRITLFHASNGSFFVLMNDQDGNNILSNSVAPYSAVAGQEIELEFSWDLINGKVRFFGQGFLVVEIDTDFDRSTDIDTIQIGDANADFSIRDLVFFDSVQHTANYTAGEYELPPGDFVASSATLPTFAYPGIGSILGFTAFASTVANGPRFTLNDRFWNGSAWVASDGSFAQASTVSTIIANIATLPASDALIVAVLFDDGNDRMSIDGMTITYTGQIYPVSDPALVNASGIAADELLDFAATLSAAGSDGVRFQLVVGGSNRYWTGSAWGASDGTYAQANTAAEIDANLDELDISAGATVKLRAMLHSADGSTTPTITSATLSYDFFAPVPDPLPECTVYGHARNFLGDTLATAPVLVVELEAAFFSGAFLILPFRQEISADDDGRFEVSLIETQSVTKKYAFSVQYEDANGQIRTATLGDATVPNQASANLSALTYT